MVNAPLKNIHTTYSGLDCKEYFLAVSPANDICQKIIEEKKGIEGVDQKNSSINKPTIIIARFIAKEIMEETLIRWIQKICNEQKDFTVTLNNFSSIPPDTIYLRIQDPQPIYNLSARLKTIDGFLESNNCPSIDLVTYPRMVIADHLPERIYNSAVYEFASRSFHETFTVSTIMFFKKENRQGRLSLVNNFTLSPHFPLYG